jgi:hypothetical protein
MQRRSIKEFSFGYDVPAGGRRTADDGANELVEIDLVEIGPTLKGMNPSTELHGVKSAGIADGYDHDAIRAQARDEIYALLAQEPLAEPAWTLEDRLGREQNRRLRLEIDRFRLEESLGFDEDLIKRVAS